MTKANAVSLLHALTGAGALVLSFLTRGDLPKNTGSIKAIGLAVFVVGMLLFLFALVHLRQAFLGNVEPTTDTLIRSGPYSLIRHPISLAMMISTVGIAVMLMSVIGLLASILIFAPAGIWRAKLEEVALARRFADEWEGYREQTKFIIPFIY